MPVLAAKGFETTTVDEIVAAAGVSRRTFFRYFASKEDVVVQLLAGLGEMMNAELTARPIDEPPATALRLSMAAALADCAGRPHDAAKQLLVVKMIVGTPALLARFLELQAQWQDELAGILAARYPGDDLYPALAAGTALAGAHVVLRRWSESDGTIDHNELLERVFEQIAPALAPPAAIR
jgi:AcrR family transcriptional regulator